MGLRSDRQYLTKLERENGLRWDELHAFTERIQLPDLPPTFPISLLPENMCFNKMNSLENCVRYGVEREHPKRPYERLPACKHLWVNFERCVRKRDATIAKSVIQWEKEFTSELDEFETKQYISELELKKRYAHYLSVGSNDISTKFQEDRFFAVWDRIISIKKGKGVGLNSEESEREKLAKARKVANLASVTRTITSRILLLKQQPNF